MYQSADFPTWKGHMGPLSCHGSTDWIKNQNQTDLRFHRVNIHPYKSSGMEDAEPSPGVNLGDNWRDSLSHSEIPASDRTFPDNHIHTIQNCASSSQNEMQFFIPWLVLQIESLLFLFTHHPINLNSTIYITARLTSVSKSRWIRLCVWSVIFILGAWEWSPEIAHRYAGVKCWGKSISWTLQKTDKEIRLEERGWRGWMIK